MVHSIVLKKLMGRVTELLARMYNLLSILNTDYVNIKIGCRYMFHYKKVCRGITENHVLASLAVF